MGVFATRSPYRPNSLGLSLVKLVGIEHTKSQGDVLVVEGVDLLDGTPIYDIKPYLATDVKTDAKFGFSTDCDSHRLDVDDAKLSAVKDENAREKSKNVSRKIRDLHIKTMAERTACDTMSTT